MYTLGLNLYHADSSASIFRNAELVAAAEEERFVRKKHWAGIPFKAIEFCLNSSSIGIEGNSYSAKNDKLLSISYMVFHYS